MWGRELGCAAPLRIEANRRVVHGERAAADQHAQIRGRDRADGRRGNTHEEERRTPDRRERNQPRRGRRRHLRRRFSISSSRFFTGRPQA